MDRIEWLFDLPISKRAFFALVRDNWAPRGTRAYKLQLENYLWWEDDVRHVMDKTYEEFTRRWRIMSIRNRRRPRGLRRIGNGAKRKEAFFKMLYKRLKPIFESTVRVHREVYELFLGQWNNPYLGRHYP